MDDHARADAPAQDRPDSAAVERGAPRPDADQTPATSLWRYIWLMSGWRQAALAALACAAAGLNLAPLELQRRMVDDAISAGDVDLLIRLAAIYGAALLLLRATKYALAVYQAWVAERTIAYTRRHLLRLRRDSADPDAQPGGVVSIVNSEVEKLGGYVGSEPSGAVANAATLLGVLVYLTFLDPRIALLSAALLAPQALLTPLVQRRLNRLVSKRVGLLRGLGDSVAGSSDRSDGAGGIEETIDSILANRLSFARLKALLKALLNMLNSAAPLLILLYGGWLATKGETTLGVLLAFVSGFERISSPVRNLIAFYRATAQASVQHEMIADWMVKLRGAKPADADEEPATKAG
jgi:ABC-type multidrug transport system fused ATPase/permease subunit